MKYLLYILTTFIFTYALQAQPACSITHFTTQEGLAQNTVVTILQDRKGILWFGTWGGLSRFDGYKFTNYKAPQTENSGLSNSRIDNMIEDHYGFIWILTYNNNVQRFNPQNGVFEAISIPGKTQDQPLVFTRIDKISNGEIWLYSPNEGAVRIRINPQDTSIRTTRYATGFRNTPSNTINHVYQDVNNHIWLLTHNGLATISPKTDNTTSYFYETKPDTVRELQSFSSVVEINNELWFGSIKGRIWRYQFNPGRFQLLETNVKSSITDLKQLNKDQIVATTSNDGFFIINNKTLALTQVSTAQKPMLQDNHILSAHPDSHGDIWFQQNIHGITRYVPSTSELFFYPTKPDYTALANYTPAFFIIEDKFGHLWLHPNGGGFSFFDRQQNKLVDFYNTPGAPNWRFSNILHSLYSDRQGILWMGTRSKGLEKIVFLENKFQLFTPHQGTREPFSDEVRAVLQDYRNRYWVATKDGLLRLFDAQKNYLGYLCADGRIAQTGKAWVGTGYALLEDPNRHIWLGTRGDGLFQLTPTSNALKYQLLQYKYDASNVFSISNDNIYSLYHDSYNRIWVATYGGGINYFSPTPSGPIQFVNARNLLKNYPIGRCQLTRFITKGADNSFLLGTTNGLISFDGSFTDPVKLQFHRYSYTQGDTTCLRNNDVHYICHTKKGETYLATFGGGLNKLIYKPDTKRYQFRTYTTKDGLASDVLLAVLEDNIGNLWISSENAITKFNPTTQVFENFDEGSIGRKILMSEASALVGNNQHELLFGTTNGLVCLNPLTIHKSAYSPTLIFNSLLLFNKEISSATNPEILTNNINESRKLTFSYQQNVFAIEYAALDYMSPEKIQYAVKLDGFDSNWNFVNNLRIATYTNLPHGKYTFRVKSTNSEGVWGNNEKSIEIEIQPQFWDTYWAKLFYFLVIVLITTISSYIILIIYKLRHSLSMEQQITELKLRFFTDISHELRTPLTLITSPLEHLLNRKNLPPEALLDLKLVETNTNRMLVLINQILDFVKIESLKMNLQVEEICPAEVISRIMDNFRLMADENQIAFTLTDETNAARIYADLDKFQKIIFNILSNAFKFTPPNNGISIHLETKKDSLTIHIKDSGNGISDSKKKLLFSRFESFIDRSLFQQASSGIGLSLVKQLADLHKATIEVESTEGVGTRFSIEFRKGIAHFDSNTEFLITDEILPTKKQLNLKPKQAVSTSENSKFGTQTTSILIVEDNNELRGFLRTILEETYEIFEAKNGKEGLSMAERNTPDLILSDLMMREMDGLGLLSKLRDSLQTCHIPVILLSAKTDIDSKIQGMELGADDYITKPFSTQYLLARIENILTQRKQLQEIYRQSLGPQNTGIFPEQPKIHSNDQLFIQKLMPLMETHMSNGSLVVEDLAAEMAVSRSVFFKKIKTLTGLAPVEFIKEMRMKRAAQLIETSDMNITQIAYMVGINDPRYFSKCFKLFYDKTPSEYRDNKLKQ